jgi:1,4-dihydroxy-2-naphthoyl-CoA hydrolase
LQSLASLLGEADSADRLTDTRMTDPTAQQISDLMPFAKLVGIELLEVGPDLVRGRLEWTPERCTTAGLMHGGAMLALADSCGGVCAFLKPVRGRDGTATIESKTNFMRGVSAGALTAITRPLYTGRTMIVVESELAREDGKLAAKVTQTQVFHYPR